MRRKIPAILASASPRRLQLLNLLHIHPEVIIPAVDESPDTGETPEEFTLRIAREKGESIMNEERKNSLVISASKESMVQIAELVGRLDSSGAKRQRVYVYPLEYADVNNVATILRGMFEENATTRSGEGETLLTTRSAQGASDEIRSALSAGARSSRR